MNFKKIFSTALGIILVGTLVVGCMRPIGPPMVPLSPATPSPAPATRTPTATATLSATPTSTASSTPTPASSFTPITTPTFVIPSTGIFVGAYMYADAISGALNVMLAVNGAAENDPVTYGIIGATSTVTGNGTQSYTGGTVETYYAGVSCVPGASFIIGVQTSGGTASVTLTEPGNPVYSSTNTFTWSPSGNASFSDAIQQTGGGALFQSESTMASITSPYTFPPAAFPSPGSYELKVTADNETTQVTGASLQSYFIIESPGITIVSE